MRRLIISIFFLAAVAISMGVVLPRRNSLQTGPDPIIEQINDRPPQCAVLRKMYKTNNGFVAPNGDIINVESFNFDDDNKLDTYKEYVSKREDFRIEQAFDDSRHVYSKLFSQQEDYQKNYYYQPKPYNNNDEERVYETPVSNVDVLHARNNDVLIQNDNGYFDRDEEVASRNPTDYAEDNLECTDKITPMYQPPFNMPPDVEMIDTLDEPAKMDINQVPVVMQVAAKRFDTSDEGEKEIPDPLEFNEGDGVVQKKLFSFWSRLQALSHKGRQLPSRRHTFVYYGQDGTRDGALTAETRAFHLRPPGQPLRWG